MRDWGSCADQERIGGAIVSSEYPGANYVPEEMQRVARELRSRKTSTGIRVFPSDAAVAEEMNRLGWTGRRGGPLYAANIGRLIGPVMDDAQLEDERENAEDEAEELREFREWKQRRLKAQLFAKQYPEHILELLEGRGDPSIPAQGPYYIAERRGGGKGRRDEDDADEGYEVLVEVTGAEYLEHLKDGRERQLRAWRELCSPWVFRDPWIGTTTPRGGLDIGDQFTWGKEVDGLVLDLARKRAWDLHDILDRAQGPDPKGSARSQLRKVCWGVLKQLVMLGQENLHLRQRVKELEDLSRGVTQVRDVAAITSRWRPFMKGPPDERAAQTCEPAPSLMVER
jgi:hypothetical protein